MRKLIVLPRRKTRALNYGSSKPVLYIDFFYESNRRQLLEIFLDNDDISTHFGKVD